MKKQLSKNRRYQLLTIFIATFLFSITFWEYCLDERRILPLIVAILSTTAFLANFVALFITKKFRIVLIAFLALYSIVVSFDLLAFNIKKNYDAFETAFETYEVYLTREDDEYCLLDSSIIEEQITCIIGKKEKSLYSKYKPLSFFYSGERDTTLQKIIPKWFIHYADIIDPTQSQYNVYYYGRRCSNYFSWLYPGYIFSIPSFNLATGENIQTVFSCRKYFDTYGFHDKELILLPKPLFRQLLRERDDLVQRWYTYTNIIKYTFNSPFVKSPVKYPHILKKETITTADLDSLGLNAKQKKMMMPYVK